MHRPAPFSRTACGIAAAGLAALLTACAGPARHDMSAMPAADGALPVQAAPFARAQLRKPDGTPAGTVLLAPAASGSGVDLAVTAEGLTPGTHGFHVHANGACAPGPDAATGQIIPFGAAGGHFDPGQSHNHGRPGQPPHEAHAGELPNLVAGADGRATLRYINPHLSATPGPLAVMGRTLVVHDNADDYATNPAGNSGGRALCGVIEPAQPGPITGRVTFEGSNVYPEGIAVDARNGTAYVGSSSEGHIYKLAPGATQAELLQQGGSPGRQAAFGMKVDGSGRLWVAGGPNGTVSVIDTASAATLAIFKAPPGPHTFLNDLVLASDGYAYVTDSFRPVLFRVRTAPGTPATLEPWLDLAATPVRYLPNQINFNGIVASADGRWLLAIQLVTGQLWRIETRTKAVSEVRIEGGELKNGDGLVLAGPNDLWVMRNADNELVRVTLANGWASGRVVQRVTDARLKYPTTAVLTPQGLRVVNGQLDKQKAPPPLLPFDVVTVQVAP